MALTNDQLALARSIYELYWESYIRGDLKTFASTLDEDFEMIGTSESEVAQSKAEGIEFYKAQMAEVVGKVEMRNRQISAKPLNDMVLVNETCDIYVWGEPEWMFYSKIRISTLLHETASGWKVIQQHGSLPDMRVQEGETLALEKITKENLELRDAVKRRTIELENKNRELAIESALEKVRAVAMGIKKPEDMLEVCRIISDQLQDFGVEKIRNIQTAIIDEKKGIYLCYQYFTPYDKEAVERTEYLKSPVEHGMVRQMMASKDGHFTGTLSGRELEEFREHRKAEEHFPDPILDESKEISHCFLSIGEGGLGLTLYQPMDTSTLELFKRFHQVFSLAYSRFQDIQKAEARAREAQIEVAVEKVRVQSMAMHHPDDLDKVNKEILTQLNWLQIQGLSGVTFYLVDQDGWVKAWDFSSPGNIGNQNSYTLQFDFKKYEMMGYPFRIFQQTDLNYLVAEYPLEKLEKAVFEIEEINPEVATIVKEALAKGILTHQWSACARITDGLLGIDLVSPPSEDTKTIVLKIAGAFNQAYQRFLDLQKAEAQAREAQIEAALERVRSRSMAMHNSQELKEVALELRKQMGLLGQKDLEVCAIHLYGYGEDSFESWSAMKAPGSEAKIVQSQAHFPKRGIRIIDEMMHHYTIGTKDYVLVNEGEKMAEWFKVMKKHAPELHASIVDSLVKKTLKQLKGNWAVADFSGGALVMVTYGEPDASARNLLRRSANVFEQAYIRFLDLQKAETQAREAQIQLSLERIRSKAMAMQHSDELSDFLTVLFEQFEVLNLRPVNCILSLFDIENNRSTFRMTGKKGATLIASQEIDLDVSPVWKQKVENWKSGYPNDVDVLYIPYENLPEIAEIFKEILEKLPENERPLPEDYPNGEYIIDGYCKYGYLGYAASGPPSDKEKEITRRIANEFGNVYQRFLDLEKAEAQAREAQIQLALERVRARTMSMQKSQELPEAANLLFQQIQSLGMPAWSAGYCTWKEELPTEKEGKSAVTLWMSSEGVIQPPFFAPTTEDKLFIQMREGAEKGKDLHVVEMGGEELEQHYRYMRELPVVGEILDSIIEAGHPLPTFQIMHQAYFSKGFLLFITYEPVLESHEIFKRFAKVFEQTYTRFLDLQKAEAQAREAQIEAALERVRSRSMGMQKSEELRDVIKVIFEQLVQLNFDFSNVGFLMDYRENDDYNVWMADKFTVFPTKNHIPWFDHPINRDYVDSKNKGLELFTKVYSFEEKNTWFEGIWKYLTGNSLETKETLLSTPALSVSRVYLKNIALYSLNFFGTTFSDAQNAILMRFGKVFEQTYTRFLDLQKAEAQAREAKIENALERVRSRAMAMHSSNELAELVATVFRELTALDFELTSCIIWSHNAELLLDEIWVASREINKPAEPYYIKPFHPSFFKSIIHAWKARDPKWVYELSGEGKAVFQEGFFHEVENLPDALKATLQTPDKVIFSASFNRFGAVEVVGTEPLSDEKFDLLHRFGQVFEQTYTRFLDLQKAEAQAREAVKQASLDRVRGVISSMRSATDLALITPLIFKELTILGVPFIRCGVFIIHEKQEIVEAYLSSPDGNSLGVLRLPFKASELTFHTVEAWRKGLVLRQHWNKEDFVRWIEQLMKQDQIQDRKTYQGSAAPPESLDLNFIPFTQGMLYVGSTSPLGEEEIEMVKSLAKAFSIAYARYEDFIKLDRAKSDIEQAMTELKATQAQLIQQEKLASLGQLTAGIAHEIQNPLNFVNNFSEVNNELIDEQLEEIEKGDLEEIKELALIMKENSEKITLHGKRADAIVKGMLEHSKTGSGKKEPTNLNALAEEFSRLAFNSFLAKNKDFKGEYKLELDPELPLLEVVPQDIGKVLLNLLNNAFYACAEQRKDLSGFENLTGLTPTVTVSTKNLGDKIQISVKDNGPGIPEAIKDKIFQPFFTTKPTGQGTGLGLSLSYDIIKAHGGEIHVESKPGKLTTFEILLLM